MWLRPSKINRFYRCLDYPTRNGHATYDQFKAFIKNPEQLEAKFYMEDFPPVFSFEEQENQVQASTTVDDKKNMASSSDEAPVEEAPDDASMLIPDEMDLH